MTPCPHPRLSALASVHKQLVALFCALLVFAVATMVQSQLGMAARGMPELMTNATYRSLVATFETQATVQFLVHVDTDFVPVGELSHRAVLSQEGQIRRAQNAVRLQFTGTNVTVLHLFTTIPYMVVEANATGLGELVAADGVVDIAEDRLEFLALAESLPNMGGTAAHNAGYTGAGQTVVVIDSGVDRTHDAFGGGSRIIAEGCFSTTSPSYHAVAICPGGVSSTTAVGAGTDCVAAVAGYPGAAAGCAHGTHVASIAVGNDEQELIGVAPQADLIAIQASSLITSLDTVGFFPSDIIRALEYVLTLHSEGNDSIAAVNLSIGGSTKYTGYCDDDARKSAIDNLRSVGIATIIAAGNNGFTDGLSAPSCISSAISVGATDDAGDLVVDFSNVGETLNLLAPGRTITAALPGNKSGTKSGTSMAAPHVAGAWALLRAAAPLATIDEILAALQTTAKPVDDLVRADTMVAHGEMGSGRLSMPRINVGAALAVINTPTAMPTATSTITPTKNPLPTATAIAPPSATQLATNTPLSTATTLAPTDTPAPTPQPTNTATTTKVPQSTSTQTLVPTAVSTGEVVATPTPRPPLPIAGDMFLIVPEQTTSVRVTLPNGWPLRLSVPRGAVLRPTTLHVHALDAPTLLPARLRFAGVSFAIDAYQEGAFVDPFPFALPIIVELTYRKADLDGLDPSLLMLYSFAEENKQWRTDGISVIERNNDESQLMFAINHLTDFALFLVDATSNGANERIYVPIVARYRWKLSLFSDNIAVNNCFATLCISP